MAKKRNNTNQVNMISVVVLFIGVIASLLLVFTSFKAVNENTELSLTGLKLAFGFKETNKVLGQTIIVSEIKANMLFTIALFLPVVAGLVQLVKGKLTQFVSILLFIAAIIFLFMVKDVSFIAVGLVEVKIDITLTILGYISLVLSVLGILGTGYKLTK